MSEDLLGGILGDEEEKPEVEAPEALASATAFAAAVAAIASRQDRRFRSTPRRSCAISQNC
jgi:hypothetical protein